MTREEFAKTFIMLSKYYGKQVENDVLEIYFSVIGSWPVPKYNECSKILLDTFNPTSTKPFPLIADFKEAIGDTGKNKAKSLISQMFEAMSKHGAYESIDFGSPGFHGVIDRYGGWAFLCRQDDEWWQFNQKRFEGDAEAAINMSFNGPSRVVGIFEIDNTEKKLLADIPEPIVINKPSNPQLENSNGTGSMPEIENLMDKFNF